MGELDPARRHTVRASCRTVASSVPPMLTGPGWLLACQRAQPRSGVADEAQCARLAAVAGHRDGLAAQRLGHERRDHASVICSHARAVGVEDPGDPGVHAPTRPVGHRERLGEAFRLVVDAARPDRVDVAPVALRLRVHEWVPVHLRRRGEHETRAVPLCELEGMPRAEAADEHRLHGQCGVVQGGGGRSEMHHLVHTAGHLERLRHVGVDEGERRRAVELVDDGAAARREVVDRNHLPAVTEQSTTEPRPKKSRTAGDYDAARRWLGKGSVWRRRVLDSASRGGDGVHVCRIAIHGSPVPNAGSSTQPPSSGQPAQPEMGNAAARRECGGLQRGNAGAARSIPARRRRSGPSHGATWPSRSRARRAPPGHRR